MTLGVSVLRENDLVYAGYLDDVIQVKVVLTVVVNACYLSGCALLCWLFKGERALAAV